MGEDPLDFANCSYLPLPDIAIGEMISVYNTKENGLFITYYFNAMMRKSFAKMVEGANVSNLYYKYLEDIEMEVPCKEEQNKIVKLLSSIDNKIESIKIEIEQTIMFKKGLLQQMFV
nr:restriction endonuclease subunit S [uncultured Christiangramia sp.]